MVLRTWLQLRTHHLWHNAKEVVLLGEDQVVLVFKQRQGRQDGDVVSRMRAVIRVCFAAFEEVGGVGSA